MAAQVCCAATLARHGIMVINRAPTPFRKPSTMMKEKLDMLKATGGYEASIQKGSLSAVPVVGLLSFCSVMVIAGWAGSNSDGICLSSSLDGRVLLVLSVPSPTFCSSLVSSSASSSSNLSKF